MAVKKPSNWPAKIDWVKIPEEQKELYANLYGKIDNLERRSTERRSGVGIDRDETAILNIQDSIENFDQDLLNQIEESLENMARSGAFFAREGRFTRGLQEASKEMALLFGQSQRAAGAFQFLTSNLRGFGQLGDQFVKGNKALTGALALQQAAFERAGVSATTFKDNVDMMIYSFGLNAKEVQSFNFQIKNLAEDLKMMPEEVSRNFQLVAKNLSYDIGTVSDQFARIQKLSVQTGVDVGTISGQFGTGMDTIAGASGAAANINALLGRNAFSATELLMMDEATRAESVREAIMNDPRLKASLAKGGPEAKFALDTIKDILGMSREDTRRFITTGKLEDADKPPPKPGEEASLKSKISERVDSTVAQESINKFSKTVGDVDKELAKLVEDIKEAQLSPMERDRLEFRRRKLMSDDPETFATRIRGQRRTRDISTTLEKDYTEQEQFVLTQQAPFARILPELERTRAQGVIKEEEFRKQIKILLKARGAAQQNIAADKVREFLRQRISATPGAFDEGRAGLDRVTISQMQSITQIPGVGEREMAQITRYFREKSADPQQAKEYIDNINLTVKELNEAEEELKKAKDKDKKAAQEKVDNKRKRLLNAIDDKDLDADRDIATKTTTADAEGARRMMEEMRTTGEKRSELLNQRTGEIPDIMNPVEGSTIDLDSAGPVDFILPIQKQNQQAALSEQQRNRILTRLEQAKSAQFKFRAEDQRGVPTPSGEVKVFNQTITMTGGDIFAKLKQKLKDGILTLEEFKMVVGQ